MTIEKNYLPRISRPAEGHYSICQAELMVGKTIERVEYGFREEIKNVHQSEVLIMYFTDGSIMAIDTGSNALNIADSKKGLKANDFHADLQLTFINV